MTVPSEFGSPETIARLEAAINAAGMTVYARIDHGAAAGAVHLALGLTELVIFGNAKGHPADASTPGGGNRPAFESTRLPRRFRPGVFGL